MRLTPGTRLGPYEITGTLGAGGMGEVYRAHDARLGRDVAIKILPAAVAGDPERMARFEREARLLASLQHPNIAAIYGLEEDAGQRFIVMECVEGQTLAERIAPRGLPVPDALDVCRQIAAALEAAHEGGVIHRDLKPGNVKITPAGEVKVLDFGLAKGGSVSAASDENLSASPTMTYGATGVGVILGTAAYMSPEQARGKAVDRRTDIWSFGAVLFECLTGRQCFAGETLSDTIAKILQGEPEWNDLPAKTPSSVRNLLARCLERDAKKRLRDIGDARIELDEAIAGASSTSRASGSRSAAAPNAKSGASRWLAIGAAAGLLLGIAGTEAVRSLSGADAARVPLVRYTIDLPDDLRMRADDFTSSAIWDMSADGTTIALLGQPRSHDLSVQTGPRAFVRRLAEEAWKPVPGSEMAGRHIAFSPDGRSLHFVSGVSAESQDARILRSSLDGDSPASPIIDVPRGSSALLLADGRTLLLHANGHQYAIAPPGATQPPEWKKIIAGPFADRIDLSPTTGGGPAREQIFVGTTTYGEDGWHRGTAVFDLAKGTTRSILRDGQWAVLRDDHLIFTRGDAVFAARFDRGKQQVVGEPVPLLKGVRTRGSWIPGRFQLTDRGDLVFATGGPVGERRDVVTIDVAGHESPLSTESRAFERDPATTPDAKRVAVTCTNPRGIDEIWLLDAPDRTPQRVVSYPDADVGGPVLSRDGHWLAFTRQGAGGMNGIYVEALSGDSEPHAVFRVNSGIDSTIVALQFSADGRRLLARIGPFGVSHLVWLDAQPAADVPAKPHMLLPTYNVGYASVSPNERFLAFDADRSGHSEVYVCSLAPDGTTGEPVVVARNGFGADWSGDGTRVFFGDSTFAKCVRVSTTGGISAGPPTRMYDLADYFERIDGLSALPDGRVIAVLRAKEDVEATRLEVIQNWFASVRGKLP
jgi:eukaryotic-like serine/threonine-protein kinase